MKLMASDMDGTLFFHFAGGHSEAKPGDLAAIRRWQAAGNLFGICTGRSPKLAYMDTDGILECDFYIATTGAVILDREKKVIFETLMDRDTAREIADFCRDRFVTILQVDLGFVGYGLELPFFEHIGVIRSFDELDAEKIYGVSVLTKTEAEAAQICEYLEEHYPAVKGFQNKASVDIVSSGCSKGEALKKVKELFQADVSLAIGDSYNDLPMILEADIGLTFRNSEEKLQQQADRVVDSIEEAIAMEIDEIGGSG